MGKEDWVNQKTYQLFETLSIPRYMNSEGHEQVKNRILKLLNERIEANATNPEKTRKRIYTEKFRCRNEMNIIFRQMGQIFILLTIGKLLGGGLCLAVDHRPRRYNPVYNILSGDECCGSKDRH